MKILTCNIRCYGAEDGVNNWTHRRDLCGKVITSRSPDIVCFQEMWEEQFTDLAPVLAGYQWYAMADEPVGRRPMNCIFYRSDAFTLVSAGGYWLSENPHVAGSSSWNSACVRLANWVRLQDRATGMAFRVVNTHLDHVSQPAREHQAQLLVADATAYPDDYPQILTGDMNCDARNPAIAVLKQGGWRDTYGAIHGTEDPGHTFHAFSGPGYAATKGKMDWIFRRGAITPVDAEVITDADGDRFPSDHYFVSATVTADGGDPVKETALRTP